MSGHAKQNLMNDRTEGKHGDTRPQITKPPFPHRSVNVSLEIMVNGQIPCPPISPDRAGIPPRVVESPVCKTHDLGEGVECGVEEAKETGEPGDQTHGRQLQYPLNDFGEMEFLHRGNRVVQNGPAVRTQWIEGVRRVLGDYEP